MANGKVDDKVTNCRIRRIHHDDTVSSGDESDTDGKPSSNSKRPAKPLAKINEDSKAPKPAKVPTKWQTARGVKVIKTATKPEWQNPGSSRENRFMKRPPKLHDTVHSEVKSTKRPNTQIQIVTTEEDRRRYKRTRGDSIFLESKADEVQQYMKSQTPKYYNTWEERRNGWSDRSSGARRKGYSTGKKNTPENTIENKNTQPEAKRDNGRDNLSTREVIESEKRRSSLLPPVQEDGTRQIGKIPSRTRIDGNKAKEDNQILTSEQVNAFKEVFDLFDNNGGGTIDGDELHETLVSVGINLDRDDTKQILLAIDLDGNGEIDFQEFLQLMTNTERFLEAVSTSKNDHSNVNERLLFDALTEFMKKSALSSINEIVGYYHTKYKRVQVAVPHVVNHYAAGARLIGLTEKQIKQHLQSLKASNDSTPGVRKSPYAQPLHIITSATSVCCIKPIPKNTLPTKTDSHHTKGKIKLVVQFHSSNHDAHIGDNNDGGIKQDHYGLPRNRVGWVSQRTEHIEVKLPSIAVQGSTSFDHLTAEDLPSIRDTVGGATHQYRDQRKFRRLRENLEHWHCLDVHRISPFILRKYFQTVFSHYSTIPQRHLTWVTV